VRVEVVIEVGPWAQGPPIKKRFPYTFLFSPRPFAGWRAHAMLLVRRRRTDVGESLLHVQ